MADFKQALKWMKEGKKVRRPHWGSKYLSKSTEYRINYDMFGKFQELEIFDFEATDWEIYEVKDNWNAMDNLQDLGDLKTLKEKILKDINKSSEKIIDDYEEDGGREYILEEEVKEIIKKRFGL